MSSPKALSAAAQGTACHSQNRQHRDSCVHQQAGGFGLPNPLQTGNSSMAMGSSTVQFTQGRSCARAPKRGGGRVVQRGTKSRRVEAPPPGGRGNLVPIWQGGGRPVCDQRIFSLPTFLLPEERRSSSGMGCAGAPLAADSALHLPPFTLLQALLHRVQMEQVRLILVAPFWPHMSWFSMIPTLLEGQPWMLPLRGDLLSQAGGKLFHTVLFHVGYAV